MSLLLIVSTSRNLGIISMPASFASAATATAAAAAGIDILRTKPLLNVVTCCHHCLSQPSLTNYREHLCHVLEKQARVPRSCQCGHVTPWNSSLLILESLDYSVSQALFLFLLP